MRNLAVAAVLFVTACGSDAAPAPDAHQTQQIAQGTGAATPLALQLYALAGRTGIPDADASFSVDLDGFHVDASVTTPTPDAAAYHFDVHGMAGDTVVDATADLTVTRLTAYDRQISGTLDLSSTARAFDQTLALGAATHLTYDPTTNVLRGSLAAGIDATLDGASIHIEDAALTVTETGAVHLAIDATDASAGCFAIDTTTGEATAVDLTVCEAAPSVR